MQRSWAETYQVSWSKIYDRLYVREVTFEMS